MSFKYTSRHHGWYAAQVPHGTTYVALTLSLLIRPVWSSYYEELVSLSKKKIVLRLPRLGGGVAHGYVPGILLAYCCIHR